VFSLIFQAWCCSHREVSFETFVCHASIRQFIQSDADMKFGKTYSEYIEKYGRNRLSGCSYVEFKRLKKLLKKCPLHDTHTAGGVTDTPCTLLSSDVHTCGKSQEDVCLDSVPTQCDSSCPGEQRFGISISAPVASFRLSSSPSRLCRLQKQTGPY
jgi:hypothetical protein